MSTLITPGYPHDPEQAARSNRRGFFKLAGAGTFALATIASGCDSEGDDDDDDPMADVTIDFSNDFGVLNYAYALEQLEAAFYAQVIANAQFASIFNGDEQTLMRDIAAHEAVHRNFLEIAINANGGTALPDLTPDFSAITFSNRDSVLATARTFEDLGVAAYNGAGKRLVNPTYLGIAGKIVSVEARHAAAIRDVLVPRSPASVGEAGGGLPEVIGANALDLAMEPGAVLAAAQPFIMQTIAATNL